jgi:hypothetical protein
LTLTTGLSVFGIRSSPRLQYETAPSTMSAAVIIIAKTGRLTLTSDRIIDASLTTSLPLPRPRPRRPNRRPRLSFFALAAADPDRRARRELIQIRRGERFVTLQPVRDFPQLALVRAERDDLLPRLVCSMM